MKIRKLPLLLLWVAAVLPLAATAQSWVLPKDAQGWTILEPSSDSRLIYVSASGNDSTAQYYSLSQVGPDPRNPSISVNAYMTLAAALNQVQNNSADWILLKAGDTFTHASIEINKLGMGRAFDERLVLTWYGSGNQRPIIKTTGSAISGNKTSYAASNGGIFNWAFIGVEFYHSNADPNSPDYNPSTAKSGSSALVAGGSDILIEDCIFRYQELAISGHDGPWENIVIRRNLFLHQSYSSSCVSDSEKPSSVFFGGITNYLIEENVSDYGGWDPDVSGAGRNQYNHGFYLHSSNQGDLYFLGNIITRAGGNAAQNRAGGLVMHNVSIQCPAGLFTARDTSSGNGATPGMTAAIQNVVLEGIWMGNCTQSSNANWGMPLAANLETGTVIQANIIAHNIDPRGSIDGIQGNHSHLNYIDNIVYDFSSSDDMWDPSWPDPDRTVGDYNASIGGTGTTEAFIEALRSRGLHSWPYELTAYALIDYIREGFGLDPIDGGNSGGSGDPVNLAEGKSVTASAFQNDGSGYQPPSLLVDGDTDNLSRWSANGMPQWAIVDLGAVSSISEIRVYPFQQRDYQYTVQISADGSSYTTIVDRSNNTVGATVLADTVSATGRYVRLNVLDADDYTGSWVAINELEVMGTEPSGSEGYITRDYWTGISGITVASLTGYANYPSNPTGSDTLTSLEGVDWTNPSVDRDWGTSYGQRIYGFLHAPATGSYTFWIAGDDECALYLSTDASPTNAALIAEVPGYSGWRVWNKYPAQKSASISLTQGQVYYIEVVHKEGSGGDHVSVGWAKPGQGTSAPSEVVPGSVLSPW